MKLYPVSVRQVRLGQRLATARYRGVTVIRSSSIALCMTVCATSPLHAVEIADPKAWMPDGPVYSTEIREGTLYLGGAFNLLAPQTGAIVSLDAKSGSVATAWPEIEGSVNAIAPDGAGGYYVGGSFLKVGAHPRQRLAHFRADGSMDDWAPLVDGEIHAIQATAERILVGGRFTSIGGVPRRNIAAVHPVTGAVLAWDPAPDRTVHSMAIARGRLIIGGEFVNFAGLAIPRLAVVDLDSFEPIELPGCVGDCVTSGGFVSAIAASEHVLFLGGAFTEMYGAPVRNACALDLDDRALLPWAPDLSGVVGALAVAPGKVILASELVPFEQGNGYEILAVDSVGGHDVSFRRRADEGVRELLVVDDRVYLGGSFFRIDGERRIRAAALDLSSGSLLDWAPSFSGPVNTMAWDGGQVLAAGAFQSAGGVERLNAAAIDLRTGSANAWSPRASLQVMALQSNYQSMFIGGYFQEVGGVRRERIAEVDLVTGGVTPWDPGITGISYASVRDMTIHGGQLYVAGEFLQAGGLPRTGVAAIDTRTGAIAPWDARLEGTMAMANAISVGGRTAYVGGRFARAGGESRRNLAALDLNTGAVGEWRPEPDYTVYALELESENVLVGGGFASISGVPRAGLARIDTSLGLATAWAPPLSNGFTSPIVFDVDADTEAIRIVGIFSQIGPEAHKNAARVDASLGDPLDWTPQVGGSGTYAYTIEAHQGSEWVGGDFASVAGRKVTGLAHIVSDETPPVANASAPGGDIFLLGIALDIVWAASDDIAVRDVDIRLSRSGPNGPWEPIALACRNSGRYSWTPEGLTTDAACIRLDFHDYAGRSTQILIDGLQLANSHAEVWGGPSLLGATPNPVSGSAIVRYRLTASQTVAITLLDMQGRVIRKLVDGPHGPGEHSLPLHSTGLSTGMYWIRMESPGFSRAHRVVVVR